MSFDILGKRVFYRGRSIPSWTNDLNDMRRVKCFAKKKKKNKKRRLDVARGLIFLRASIDKSITVNFSP